LGLVSNNRPFALRVSSPTSDGAAAVVLANEAFVIKHGLQDRAVEILALEMATDVPGSFEPKDIPDTGLLVGTEMSKLAAKKAFEKAHLTPADVQVVELHDCFAANELITYEALGLCAPGKAVQMVNKGDNTYGGKYVINPSGGLISKGHPLGEFLLHNCHTIAS
jgi:sterol carrier protein 2